MRTLAIREAVSELKGTHPAIYSTDESPGIWKVCPLGTEQFATVAHNTLNLYSTPEINEGLGQFRERKTVQFGTEAIAVSKLDRSHLVVGTVGGMLQVQNIKTGEVTNSIQEGYGYGFGSAVPISPYQVVTGSAPRPEHFYGKCGHHVQVWNLATREVQTRHRGHTGAVYSVTPLANNRFATGSTDGSVRVWTTEQDESLRMMQSHMEPIYSTAKAGNGKLLTASEDRSIKLWDVETGRQQGYLAEPGSKRRRAHDMPVYDVSTHRQMALSASGDGHIKLWDMRTHQVGKRIFVNNGSVLSAQFVSDVKVIAGTGGDLEASNPLRHITGAELTENDGHLGFFDLRTA
ncbi:MAG: hypothetical protein S4CHLAM102_02080 [Chlamydiia bacterium]|nr:hypothetical protein [Chlamydiia bacterium]